MNARPEIACRNVFSVISSFVSSGSKSSADDSFSADDCNTSYVNLGPSTSGGELFHVAEDNDDQEKNGDPAEHRKSGFRMVYVCAMATMFSALGTGYNTVYSGPATYDMQTRSSSRVKITDDEASWIGSTVAIGMLASIPLAVYLADRIGRKETLIYNCVVYVVGWLFIIYAPSAIFIIIGRFIGGAATGVIYVVLPMYGVEISSADTRGLIGTLFQACIAIGTFVAMGFGVFLTWSWLAVGGLVIVVVALIIFCPMPESPRWLVANGRKQDAIRAIRFLHADKIDAVKECQLIEENLKAQTEVKFSIQNFRQPIIYKPTLISMGQMIFLAFSGVNVIFLFTSYIFDNTVTVLDAKYCTLVLGAVQVVFTVGSTMIMDKAGRRVLLINSGFWMGLSLAALGAYFYVSSRYIAFSYQADWLPLFSLIIYVSVYSIGYGPIPWLMLSEMVPTRERSFISGVVTSFTSIINFIAIKTFDNFIKLMGFHGAFWTYSAFCFLSCLFVYFIVPETKGKQLEDIQNIFSGAHRRLAAGGDEVNSPKDGISNPVPPEQ